VLQCAAVCSVCCSIMQCVQCPAVCCSVLQCVQALVMTTAISAIVCVRVSVLQCVAVCWQCVAVWCSALQCVVVCPSAHYDNVPFRNHQLVFKSSLNQSASSATHRPTQQLQHNITKIHAKKYN